MPRGRGQNDAAVKSHPRRCSERHKEDAKAACPRLLLCANTKYTIIASLSSRSRRKSEGGGGGAAARASCDDVLCCLEHTQQTRVSVSTQKTKKKREREREAKNSLSHTHKKSKKVCVFETVLCPHEKCTDRSHVWFKTTDSL